jgi:uncharacterized protein (TIGR03435 family)
MRIARMAIVGLMLAAATSHVFTQAPVQPKPEGPTFEVVSVKPNVSSARPLGPPFQDRPDGGFTATNVAVMIFVARAYPPAIPVEMIGLPDWARTERYDIMATASVARPTADDRIAMFRAMLADRFKLAAHVEKREVPVYDLVLARRDGRLGAGIQATATDCARIAAERAANEAAGTPPPRPDYTAPPVPCTMRTIGAILRDRGGDGQGRLGDLLEGDAPIDTLATMLRQWADRPVVNATGLGGAYRVRMNFDMRAVVQGPDLAGPSPDAAPSMFTAVQEQLGLKLETKKAPQAVFVIEKVDRPSEN